MRKLFAGLLLIMSSFTVFALDYKLITEGNELVGLYSPSNLKNANIYESGCTEVREMEATVYSVTPNILNIENVIFKTASGGYYDLWIKHFVNELNKIDRQKLPYLFEPGSKFVIALKLCGSGGVESFISVVRKDDQDSDLANFYFIGGWQVSSVDSKGAPLHMVRLLSNEGEHGGRAPITMTVFCYSRDKSMTLMFDPVDGLVNPNDKSPLLLSFDSREDTVKDWFLLADNETLFIPEDKTGEVLKRIYASKVFRIGSTRAGGGKFFYTFDVRGEEALRNLMHTCDFKYY